MAPHAAEVTWPTGVAIPDHQLAAPEHGLGVVDHQRDQPARRSFGPDLLDRRPAEEVDIGLELAGEQQPGLDRGVSRA